MRVLVGTSEYLANGKNGRSVGVKALRAHPNFTIVREDGSEFGYFDVAVLRLKEAVLPSPKTSTISITKPRAEPRAGASVKVAGWGIYRVRLFVGTKVNSHALDCSCGGLSVKRGSFQSEVESQKLSL